MVYLDYITCLRYTFVIRNPRYLNAVFQTDRRPQFWRKKRKKKKKTSAMCMCSKTQSDKARCVFHRS